MKTVFFSSWRTGLRQSVLLRLGLIISFLALLSLASIVLSSLLADNLSGKANAINVSGSLRMMSFRTLSEVQQPEKRSQAPLTQLEFEKRLLALQHFILSRVDINAPQAVAMRAVVSRWQERIRETALSASLGDPAALQKLAIDTPTFVDQIDHLVYLIEEDMEQKLRWLHLTQLTLLMIVIVISLVTFWLLKRQLLYPLGQLLRAAHSVSAGHFDVRVAHTQNDELGQLGQSFNRMVAEIANMYAHLEEKVIEKTQELTRSKQALELLYHTSQALAASDLSLDTIQRVLRNVENTLELGHSMICLRDTDFALPYPVIGNFEPDELQKLCGKSHCAQCYHRAKEGEASLFSVDDAHQTPSHVAVFPLSADAGIHGALPIMLKKDKRLPEDKIRLLETVSHHIASALANMRRTEEKHRLAVLEERTVIARELHDSIAQSLSYLRIQVSRLEKQLSEPEAAAAIVQELKRGLSTAYQELRELITTFRLRIDEQGFDVALTQTLDEFGQKLGFSIGLERRISALAFSANEEIHIIRLIREALSNIERHAHATHAHISLILDENHDVRLIITDNGCGFDPHNTPANHFGTSIMHDRAKSLGGTLIIDSRINAGCTLSLRFKPQKYRESVPT